MATVGAYELKTRVAEILRRAESGESFTITNRGRPVAQIVPIVKEDDADERKRKHAEIWKVLRGTEPKTPITPEEIRAMIDDGRKY